MENLKIVKAEVTINVLKVGNKSVTKAVFRQIPVASGSAVFSAQSCLGYVREGNALLDGVWFLFNLNNTLVKIPASSLVTRPCETYELECKRSGRDPITEAEYEEWCTDYRAQHQVIGGATQLYIAT